MYCFILLYPVLFVSPANDRVLESLVRVEKTEPQMGTRFQITAYASSTQSGEQAIQKAFARIAQLNGILSDYSPDSELMRLCAQSGKGQVPVSPELFFVLQRSLELARESDGGFDPTVGPYSVLWRRARKSKLLPSEAELADAKAKVGFKKMSLDPKNRTVMLSQPGMRLDLGGIAKGYAADEALAVLKAAGINRALVAAGGDVVCGDAPPGKKGWDIALIPLPGDEGDKRHFVLANGAVSTSGDLEQFVELGGKRFAHILDSKTGLGMTTRQSASVVAPRGIDSDGLTKILLLLPWENGMQILQATRGTSGRLVSPKDPDFPSRGAVIQTVGDFPRLERKP